MRAMFFICLMSITSTVFASEQISCEVRKNDQRLALFNLNVVGSVDVGEGRTIDMIMYKDSVRIELNRQATEDEIHREKRLMNRTITKTPIAYTQVNTAGSLASSAVFNAENINVTCFTQYAPPAARAVPMFKAPDEDDAANAAEVK